VTIAGPLWCPVWCWLVTVPADPFITFTRPTSPFLSEWVKCQPRMAEPYFRLRNLMADSESGSPSSYSSLIVTIGLSHLVAETFACDRQTDNTDHYYSWSLHCDEPANKNGTVQLWIVHSLSELLGLMDVWFSDSCVVITEPNNLSKLCSTCPVLTNDVYICLAINRNQKLVSCFVLLFNSVRIQAVIN